MSKDESPPDTPPTTEQQVQYVNMDEVEGGFYHHPSLFQIGDGNERFRFTVKINEVLNMHSIAGLGGKSEDVTVLFHFAGVDLRSPSFSLDDVEGNTACLARNMVVFDISSTAAELVKFFEFQRWLTFHLCTRTKIIAVSKVPVELLLSCEEENVVAEDVSGYFELESAGDAKNANVSVSKKASGSTPGTSGLPYISVDVSVSVSSGLSRFDLGDGNTENDEYIVSSNSLKQAAMWEIESWKRREEEEFEKYLQKKEKTLMNILIQEWKDVERKRVRSFESSINQIAQLQDKLLKLLSLVERKEKQVSGELLKIGQDKEALRLSFTSEIQELQSRLKLQTNESNQLMKMEKWRTTKLIASKNQLGERNKELELESRKIQKEFDSFRQKFQHTNAGELQLRLAVTETEMKDMERRLREVAEEREHYKRVSLDLMETNEDLKDYNRSFHEKNLESEIRNIRSVKARLMSKSEDGAASFDVDRPEYFSDGDDDDDDDGYGEPDESSISENIRNHRRNNYSEIIRLGRKENKKGQFQSKRKKNGGKLQPKQGNNDEQTDTFAVGKREAASEIERLRSAKNDLLSHGYAEKEPLIEQINNKISNLERITP